MTGNFSDKIQNHGGAGRRLKQSNLIYVVFLGEASASPGSARKLI